MITTNDHRGTVGRMASQRGSILIHVGIAIIGLIAFTTFVWDYGLLWVARREAQNSADAGALAGAVAMGFDNFADRTNNGPAKQSAHRFALANYVVGQSPDVLINTDIFFYGDDPTKFPPECADDTCIRVDVYRNQERSNAIPIWFGQLVGLVDQGVKATAIARAAFGNATDCMKPWAIVDRWVENWENGMPATLPWNLDSEFDKYDKDGNVLPAPVVPDVYTPASVQYNGDTPIWSTYQPGTGFHPFNFNPDGSIGGYNLPDYGMQLPLKMGDAGDWTFGAGWFMRLDLCPLIDRTVNPSAPSNSGAQCYNWTIKNCVGQAIKIGQEIPIDNAPGSATGPTFQGVGGMNVQNQDADSLYLQDPGAHWDQSLNGGYGGVAGSAYAVSPRIVAVPLINPDALMAAFRNGRTTVPVGNIGGFFVEGVVGAGTNQRVVGRLMTMPGLKTSGAGTGGAPSTFMRTIGLIY